MQNKVVFFQIRVVSLHNTEINIMEDIAANLHPAKNGKSFKTRAYAQEHYACQRYTAVLH